MEPVTLGLADNAALLAEKPEILFPLDQPSLDSLRRVERLAIGEMAGRDSVAAILAALSADQDIDVVLPVAVYTGTEYGDWQAFERNALFLRQAARERFDKTVLDLVWMGSPLLWRALNGRFITDIVRRYGAYSPCLGCHLYLHAVRIPFARQLGVRAIIGGDRERHDHRAKINQVSPMVNLYQRLFQRFGLELREPLRALASTSDLDELLGPGWPGGSPQPDCLFSGNYHSLNGPNWTETETMAFVEGFAYPVVERVVAALVAGQPVDYVQVAREVLSA